MAFKLTGRQAAFVRAGSFEVLFGGAAGGGKSYAQIFDAVYFACRFARSKQLILRRTMPELEATLIPMLLGGYPAEWFKYKSSDRRCTFVNGSVIQFGYCGREKDVYRYQSAEYDVIRFDELTHFSEHMYTYLISRVRGANKYPKQLKSSTNPGGVGHEWVKRRFIDIGPPGVEHNFPAGSRIFLPARLEDNIFLTKRDPQYRERLKNLEKGERLALLEGEWNIAEGRYFCEWNRGLHVVEPFEIPPHWLRYFTMDYGLDMLAGYWIAVDGQGRAYVYRELYEPGLIVSEAAARINGMTLEPVREYIAPPDLWGRRTESGKSAADIFLENGLALTVAPAGRVAGWLELKEWLKPRADIFGRFTPRMVFFEGCDNIIRCLPALMRDRKNPSDCASEPHEYTHGPDAIRYFVASRLAELGNAGGKDECGGQLEELLGYGKQE